MLKEKIINGIIEREGGYVNSPADSGGETMYGITVAVARQNGWTRPMKELPRSYAFEIYSKIYWEALLLDDINALSPKIAEKLADIGVNCGTGRAGEFLQRALNVLNSGGAHYSDISVDGAVGGGTLSALRSFLAKRKSEGEVVLFRSLNCLQGAHYITLAERRQKDEAFVFGWLLNRVQ